MPCKYALKKGCGEHLAQMWIRYAMAKWLVWFALYGIRFATAFDFKTIPQPRYL
jgi:hypothetical protein